jgi:hypothetical protein
VPKDHVLALYGNLKNLIINYSRTSKAKLKTLKEGMATSEYGKVIANIKEIGGATYKSTNQLSVMRYQQKDPQKAFKNTYILVLQHSDAI